VKDKAVSVKLWSKSNPGKAFHQSLVYLGFLIIDTEVISIADDLYRSTMEVIVIRLKQHWSAILNFGSILDGCPINVGIPNYLAHMAAVFVF